MSVYLNPPTSMVSDYEVVPTPRGHVVKLGTTGQLYIEAGSAPEARKLAAALLEAADLDDARQMGETAKGAAA